MKDELSILRNYEKYLWQLLQNSDSTISTHIIYAIGSIDNYITNQIKLEKDKAITEKYKKYY